MRLVFDYVAELPCGAQLDDRGANQVNGVITPGLAFDLQPGQTVFVNGSQEGNCEIHGQLTGIQSTANSCPSCTFTQRRTTCAPDGGM